jgi:hypothetical protein
MLCAKHLNADDTIVQLWYQEKGYTVKILRDTTILKSFRFETRANAIKCLEENKIYI